MICVRFSLINFKKMKKNLLLFEEYIPPPEQLETNALDSAIAN